MTWLILKLELITENQKWGGDMIKIQCNDLSLRIAFFGQNLLKEDLAEKFF